MSVESVTLARSPAPHRPAAPAQEARPSFAAELSGAGTTPGSRAGVESAGRARDAATQFLADLFYTPMLAEMRKTPFGRRFSHGGRGEDVFGEQLDQRLGESVARADRSGLTALVAGRLAPGGGERLVPCPTEKRS